MKERNTGCSRIAQNQIRKMNYTVCNHHEVYSFDCNKNTYGFEIVEISGNQMLYYFGVIWYLEWNIVITLI